MAKKYKLKEDKMPRGVDYCGLDTVNWVKLNKGNAVELDAVPENAKQYLREIKDQKIEKVKKVKVEGK